MGCTFQCFDCDMREVCSYNKGCDSKPCPPSPIPGIPGPIKPVHFLHGCNTEEQLIHMQNRVNECINRWNHIQKNCYEALHKMTNAVHKNDIYYGDDEVTLNEGYSEYDGSPYSVVLVKAVDNKGKPIKPVLYPAYNNITNSGAVDSIENTSFIMLADTVITASPVSSAMWNGPAIFNKQPGASGPISDSEYVAGWNDRGVLMYFNQNAPSQMFTQNKMENLIGNVYPILNGGEIVTETTDSIGTTKYSIQAIGWRATDGLKMFFNSSITDNSQGMTAMGVAKVFQDMGFSTAVITNYQNAPVIPSTSTRESSPYQGARVGGMTYQGLLTQRTIQDIIPYGCAFFVISKSLAYKMNDELAQTIGQNVQTTNFTINELNSLKGKLDNEYGDFAGLKQQIESIQSATDANTTQVNNLNTRVENVENSLSTLETSVTTINNTITSIQNSITQEAEIRENADNATNERIDNLQAEHEADISTVSQDITDLKNGNYLPIATTEKRGIMSVGNGLSVLNGRVSTTFGPLNIKPGTNITVARGSDANVTISADLSSVPGQDAIDQLSDRINQNTDDITVLQGESKENTDDIAYLKENANTLEDQVNKNTTDITSLKTTDAKQTTDIAALQTDNSAIRGQTVKLAADIATNKTNIETNTTDIANNTAEIENLKTYPNLPIATETNTGVVKIGANLTISPDGTLSANDPGTPGETVAPGTGIKITRSAGSAIISLSDATANAIDEVAVLQTSVSNKVNRSGDIMTGNLTVSEESGKTVTVGTVDTMPGAIITNGESTVAATYAGASVGTVNLYGSMKELALSDTTTPAEPKDVIISGVGTATRDNHAVNLALLNQQATELEQKLTVIRNDIANLTDLVGDATTQAAQANTIATNAQTIANNAMPKTGGLFTGDVGINRSPFYANNLNSFLTSSNFTMEMLLYNPITKGIVFGGANSDVTYNRYYQMGSHIMRIIRANITPSGSTIIMNVDLSDLDVTYGWVSAAHSSYGNLNFNVGFQGDVLINYAFVLNGYNAPVNTALTLYVVLEFYNVNCFTKRCIPYS